MKILDKISKTVISEDEIERFIFMLDISHSLIIADNLYETGYLFEATVIVNYINKRFDNGNLLQKTAPNGAGRKG